ncbi:2-keto-4-pentenoate hydratase/2-oxohepta-3-ene-1,7-dioic acid hydratase in catechol pathway [Arthrobacter silviterrae]|uniref:Fumarylacetoacetate hydrolase family protein n=1 Tax=Arthrobacter silviterrae TaxID=2026658 RepID=A0ABX0DCD6_9MICC|nr:fumarylacetoacetate hydrolase family protein [Arthrobacter silviterrae]MDQ0278698.1 2-keto-4-pentenoate hydratase/2-oxohepta-3-ene-1,7-dioic acid hydratase in catechol pathway [Arthrobacter silviterrae]NGN83391.1 fumarylacetoacetate hydrolase family protein [Arthrobacter silviterrae]
MKIARLGEPGLEVPVAITAGPDGVERSYDARAVTSTIDGAFLAGGGIDKLRAAAARGELPVLAGAAALRVASPLARPNNVVCIGMNYAAHAAESGAEPPTIPVVFLKPNNTVAGPFDPAPIPPLSAKYDWEVELGVVIGREASYLASVEEAASVVAGYLIANDLSEREYQLPGAAGQWTKGKSLPQSTPLGPWLVPASDVDANTLQLKSWVNGEPRQDSNTADLIFDVPTLIHHLSHYMLLEPGDVILTGTPEGVALSGRFPYLQDGDVVELEITGLGRQRQQFFRAGTAAPTPPPAATPTATTAPAPAPLKGA